MDFKALRTAYDSHNLPIICHFRQSAWDGGQQQLQQEQDEAALQDLRGLESAGVARTQDPQRCSRPQRQTDSGGDDSSGKGLYA